MAYKNIEDARRWQRNWNKTKKGRLHTKRSNHARWIAHPERCRIGAIAHYIRRSRLLKELKNKPCLDCGGWFESYQMEYDHRKPEEKLFNVGAATTRKL